MGARYAFGFPRQRGSRDGAERRSSLKWCEWSRVSRRLECPVRAGDGPNELTLYLTARDASHAVYLSVCLPVCLSECPSRFDVIVAVNLVLLLRPGATTSCAICFHDAPSCDQRAAPCRNEEKRRPRYRASSLMATRIS